MRSNKWFISNLDDTQRQIVVSDINKNIIVQGAAGSGKTNLAIHRAKQASLFSEKYAIVIYTIALKRMVATGMKALGLDSERIAYDWAWKVSGFALNGNVFRSSQDPFTLYLVNEDSVRKFVKLQGGFSDIETARKSSSSLVVGLNFEDWVGRAEYDTYGRRRSFFEEVPFHSSLDMNSVKAIPSAVLYRKVEERMDYLVMDEVQDFSTSDLKENYLSSVDKTYALFGDTEQRIYGNNRGSSMDDIRSELKGDPYFLSYNYRLPKSIAKVAQDIPETSIDLVSYNMKDRGNSDFPNYPKPDITKYSDSDAELKGILDKIRNEDLDDVAILVPTEADVIKVYNFLQQNGVNSQVLFRKRTGQVAGTTQVFRTVNTLDMANNDLPCILTYHAAKGTEFDNVFVPFANAGDLPDRKAFYVACTRSSHSLHISFSKDLTPFLNKVKKEYVEEIDATTKSSTDLPF